VRRWSLLLAGALVVSDAGAQTLSNSPADAAHTTTVAVQPVVTNSTPATTFRSSVDLVALSVVVTDAAQQFVTGLGVQNFAVFEDGVKQDLSFFAATSVPLDLAILLDTSASMTDKLRTVQEAAIGFAATLRDSDRAMIVDIKDATKIIQNLTPDISEAKRAIGTTTARGGTALYNGLYLTLKELVKQRKANDDVRRQAIVVLSDGDDTASLIGFDDVMAEAKAAGIAIYTITLKSRMEILQSSAASGRRYFSQSDYAMRALAQETGARSFFPSDIGELDGVYGTIASELASQYAIAYTSKNPRRDGSFRRVTVRVVEHPGASTRTRTGYTAARAERKLALQ
jgi:Ca-activated chloride channel homolog